MIENPSPFALSYTPADLGKGAAYEDRVAHALDYIAHYLGQIEKHLAVIAVINGGAIIDHEAPRERRFVAVQK